MTKLEARLNDGTIVDSNTFASIENMPLDKIVEIAVQSENPAIPRVTILADLDKGERVWRFTRTRMQVNTDNVMRVEVYEIKKDGQTLVRLYWDPNNGPILTTKDLWFDN